jgi:N-acetylneuraminic acid mutarotase
MTGNRRRAALLLTLAACLVLAGCGADKDNGKGTTGGDGTFSAADLKPGLWKELDKAPGTFESSGVTVFDGKVWIAGGLDEARKPTRKVWVFDPSDESWEAGPDLPGVLTHTALSRNGDRLLLMGGFRFDSGATAVKNVWQLDEEGKRWERGPSLPIELGAAAAAWDGKRVVLAGGVRHDESTSDAVFVLEGDRWRELDAKLSEAREGLAADSDGNGKVWFMGGEAAGASGGKTEYANVDVVSGDDVAQAGEVPIPRGAVAGVLLRPATACVVGGRNGAGRPIGAVECVDAAGKQLALPSLPVGRLGMVAALSGDKLYVFGGLTRDRLASDIVTVLPLKG